MAYIKVERSRIFVTAGSFWRSEPAAALRGFAKGARPSSSAAAFKASKLFFGMYTSPRSSSVSTPGAMAARASSRRRKGTSRTVRMFTVTSSPVVPSPRVAARTSTPSS